MQLSTLRAALEENPTKNIAFVLPDGKAVPVHAHITEAGITEKRFLDCGGKFRRTSFASLQIWVADDIDHRLPAGKLASILEKASELLDFGDLEIQIECQEGSIGLFSVVSRSVEDDLLVFTLENKQTACLAPAVCLPEASEGESCCGEGSSCCG